MAFKIGRKNLLPAVWKSPFAVFLLEKLTYYDNLKNKKDRKRRLMNTSHYCKDTFVPSWLFCESPLNFYRWEAFVAWRALHTTCDAIRYDISVAVELNSVIFNVVVYIAFACYKIRHFRVEKISYSSDICVPMRFFFYSIAWSEFYILAQTMAFQLPKAPTQQTPNVSITF